MDAPGVPPAPSIVPLPVLEFAYGFSSVPSINLPIIPISAYGTPHTLSEIPPLEPISEYGVPICRVYTSSIRPL